MTNEEAIKKIEEIKEYLIAGNPIWDIEVISEACEMAVDALEAQSRAQKIRRLIAIQGTDY